MKDFHNNHIDSVVTDSPYAFGFMGKAWDKFLSDKGSKKPFANQSKEQKLGGFAFQKFTEKWAAECLRILKPGGYLLSFGGTRTYHRMVCGIEDAGFEIRDCLQWIYGSGFPKNLDISKQIDKMKGVERETIKEIKKDIFGEYEIKKNKDYTSPDFSEDQFTSQGSMMQTHQTSERINIPITVPATPEAKQWDGWGTALKPACEIIVLARKPISEKNVAENVLKWGTGGINIDGCRIETSDNLDGGGYDPKGKSRKDLSQATSYATKVMNKEFIQPKGRWPANVIFDEEAAGLLDEQVGKLTSGTMKKAYKYTNTGYSLGEPAGETKQIHESNSGFASRFFYVAKASRAERNAGLEGFEKKIGGMRSETSGQHITRRDGGDPKPVKNNHPTVKPIKLMRYLVRLITPPGGVCLDPFIGSGTTAIACILEDFDYIGIEKEKEYFDIAKARIALVRKRPKPFFKPSEVRSENPKLNKFF